MLPTVSDLFQWLPALPLKGRWPCRCGALSQPAVVVGAVVIKEHSTCWYSQRINMHVQTYRQRTKYITNTCVATFKLAIHSDFQLEKGLFNRANGSS